MPCISYYQFQLNNSLKELVFAEGKSGILHDLASYFKNPA